MITYTHEDYKNRLETRYTVEYIDNQKDMDYVNSGKIDKGEPWERYKKRTYNCIDDAIYFYMISRFNPLMLDIQLLEEILLDGEVIREAYIEPDSTLGSELKRLINKNMLEDTRKANNEAEGAVKRVYLVNKWLSEYKPVADAFNKFLEKTAKENNKLSVYRYYSLLRPVAPGTYPRQSEAKNIVNFDGRTFIEDINRYAWGYVEYEKELSCDETRDYDLEWNKHTKMEF